MMTDRSPVIEVDSLSFTYPRAPRETLSDISFTVQPGEVLGFLGPNGAGKSTVQKILIRLLYGFKGGAKVFGRDLSEWGDRFYERVGVSFELPAGYRKLTARENLDLFASLYSSDVEPTDELLDLVGLTDAADERLSDFSKGMRMRLNFIRALINKPELLFLDEPTGGLDPGNAVRIRNLIRRYSSSGTTVFLTTHDMAVADELCDRVAFIIDGRLSVIASPRELKLTHGESVVRIELRKQGELTQTVIPLDRFEESALKELRATGYDLETIHTEEATLEQVFLEVTGRKLL